MKEPWLAVSLSFLYPGLGQVYAGRTFKGCLLGLVQFLFLSALAASFLCLSDSRSLLIIILLLVLLVVFQTCCVTNAYHAAKSWNKLHDGQIPPRKKDPFLAIFLTCLMAGLGQIYNGQLLKGLVYLVTVPLLCGLLAAQGSIGVWLKWFFEIAVTLFLIGDAYTGAQRSNHQDENIFHRWQKKKVLAAAALCILLPFLSAMGLAEGFRMFFAVSFKVPGDSMSPALKPGDRVLSNKLIYRWNDPKRGDLIVMENPLNPGKQYIRRVAGLPGENIKIEHGHIEINGRPLDTPQFPITRNYTNREDWPFGKSGQTIQIPAESYFVLGDNSDQSQDSRKWGCIKRQAIKSKAYFIFAPPERWAKIE